MEIDALEYVLRELQDIAATGITAQAMKRQRPDTLSRELVSRWWRLLTQAGSWLKIEEAAGAITAEQRQFAQDWLTSLLTYDPGEAALQLEAWLGWREEHIKTTGKGSPWLIVERPTADGTGTEYVRPYATAT